MLVTLRAGAPATLCSAHGVLVCSDEVWGELPPLTRRPHFGSRAARRVPSLRERLVVLHRPQVLQCRDAQRGDQRGARPALRQEMARAGADMEVTLLATAALCIFGAESEAWRRRLFTYLAANLEYAVPG